MATPIISVRPIATLPVNQTGRGSTAHLELKSWLSRADVGTGSAFDYVDRKSANSGRNAASTYARDEGMKVQTSVTEENINGRHVYALNVWVVSRSKAVTGGEGERPGRAS